MGAMQRSIPNIAELTPEQRAAIERQLLQKGTKRTEKRTIPRRDRSKLCPLSFAQQRLWFLDQFDAGNASYVVPWMARLRGDLDVEALQKALDAIVERHEVLRTTYDLIDSSPVQIVHEHRPVHIRLVDISPLSETERTTEARRLVEEEIHRPFDLRKDLMLRVNLIRLDEAEHILLLVTHHIASDGWSMGILFRELAALYEGYSNHRPITLPELPIQYADYAVWQREWLTGDVLQEQITYWQQQLNNAPAVLELPTDYPRPDRINYQGARERLDLSHELSDALATLSRQEGATLFMTLLAAFQVLLARYTGQEDIVVGSPIAGRNYVETEGLIGFFVNTLVLRGNLSGSPSFRELLRCVKETVLGALAHQDLPFEKLVEELHPERHLNITPLFQVAFALQNTPRHPPHLGNLVVESVGETPPSAKFDLQLTVIERPEGLRLSLIYPVVLFRPETIKQMLAHYQTLLEGIAANPNQSIGELPLLTQAERKRLLFEWNDTLTEYPRDATLVELFEAQVERTPENIAVVFGNEQITYHELNWRANQLAHHLRSLGIGPGVLVATYLERSIEMVISFLGILKAGGAYVPLDQAYPKERLAFMLEDAQAPLLLTQKRLAKDLPSVGIRVLCLDSDWDSIGHERAENPIPQNQAEHLAYVIYTSGSTGIPKGVAVPHRAIVRLVMNTNYVQLDASDRIAQASNASFDAATFEIWGALLHGGTLIGITKDVALSPQEFATQLHEQRITTLFLTTALFNLLADRAPGAFRGLRHLMFGGEACDPRCVRSVLQNGPPMRLLHVYGPTESTTFATWHLIEDVPKEATTVPIGKPIANTQVYLLDQHLQPVPVGVPGEIYIGGDGLAHGYLNRPELTAERFVPNPLPGTPGDRLYKTGDLARLLPDGSIEFIGRTDHQVKIRGFRVELGEIESLLLQYPGVREAVVMLQQDPSADKRLVAYVAAKNDLSAANLRSFLQKKIPAYMVPTDYVLLDSLPLNPNGKVDRKALSELELVRSESGNRELSYNDMPRGTLEIQLAEIWEELLGIRPIGIHDDFFELGGHSLLAVRMMDQVEQVFGKRIPLTALFEKATIAHIALTLLSQNDFGSPYTAFHADGSNPPFFYLHGDFEGGGFYCANLARYLGPTQPFYAIHPHGLDGGEVPCSFREMAARHLETVRRIQPKGPYFLGGHCNGGVQAFEMARMLREEGEEVALLVLLQSTPGNQQYRHVYAAVRRLGKLLHLSEEQQAALFLQIRYPLSRIDKMRRLKPNERRKAILDKARRLLRQYSQVVRPIVTWHNDHVDFGSVGTAAAIPAGRREVVAETYNRATAAYVPGYYPGRVTVFLARPHPEKLTEVPTTPWRRFAREVDVHIVPGGHLTCLTAHAKELAEELASCIRAAMRPSDEKPKRTHEPVY
jgi:amino acid adenylation domain-containing protein